MFIDFQFDAPEKFDRESRKSFQMQKHLGEMFISPVYVQRRCDEDKLHYEVSVISIQVHTLFVMCARITLLLVALLFAGEHAD